jgi:23S rRNA (pseudouridine1915-N3)-methyltransferase
VQALQMTTVLDASVHNVAVSGATFDDCQAAVKAAFVDPAFRARHRLTAINSINWARILAQVCYSVWSYIRFLEVKDAARTGGSAARWKAQEGVALLGCMPPGARLVALDERGTPRTSRAFAEWLGRQRDTAVPAVCFLLGGPDGLDAPLRERAHEVLSFGPATLPHELARVVLLEQLYRATSILTGGPYHRD